MKVKECMKYLESIKWTYEGRLLANGHDAECEKRVEALDLALDIIYSQEGPERNSEKAHLERLIEHFEKPEKPKLNHQLDIYQCPVCNGRVRLRQGYCQKCGKKLSGGEKRKRR